MTDTLAHRLRALGRDSRTADRVQADMGRMLERHDVSAVALRAHPLEWLAAETRCAACGAVERCHRYLGGEDDEPAEFCANATEFAALRGRS
ncbi:MAG: DUF6455 family protein [Geminicoccaceae bacterium]